MDIVSVIAVGFGVAYVLIIIDTITKVNRNKGE